MASAKDKSFVEQVMGDVWSDEAVLSSAVMKAAVERRRQQFEEKMADKAVTLLTDFQNTLKSSVISLKNVRKTEAEQKDRVEKLDAAFKHFVATGNPIPFFDATGDSHALRNYCTSIGIDIPPHDSPLRKVN